MSINPATEFPGKITAPSTDYPFGEARNITIPGDGTGTPYVASLVNDIFGFQQALLSGADLVPSGSPDKVGASQYLDSLVAISSKVGGVLFDTFADVLASTAISGAVTWPDVQKVITLQHTDNLVGGATYVKDGTTGTPDTGDELKFFDSDGNGWVLDHKSSVDLYQLGGTFEGDCIAQMDIALANNFFTRVKVPDNVTIGKHEFNSGFVKVIVGGEGVIFDDTVAAAGIFPTNCGYVEIRNFSNVVMKTFPLTGGVVADGHVFVSLGSGADIDTLIIKDNSGVGGKNAITATFENSRILNRTCRITYNYFKNQNGGEAGSGYGIQVANENDVGDMYIANNIIEEAGRHSFYMARNKGGAKVSFEYNTAINHRENAPTQGSETRAAILISRSQNVFGFGNMVNGFYDSALMITEEAEAVANPISAKNIKVYATTFKNPKNTAAALFVGFITPSDTALVEDVLIDGITFECDGLQTPVMQYSWGKNVTVKNISILYENVTALTRIFVLQGSSFTGTHDGAADASVLDDSTASFEVDSLIDSVINNITDGSSGVITANTATTVTATLSGGAENDWDVSDDYTIVRNTNGLFLQDIKLRILNSSATFSVFRPVAPLVTSDMQVTIDRLDRIEITGGATVNDWEPSATVTNPAIEVYGATFPAANSVAPKETLFPSFGLEGEDTFNPPSIPDGDEVTKNITVLGAVLGDFAIGSFSLSLQTLSLSASVEATDTVTLTFHNNTGSAVDLGSGTARAKVIKKA